jgi:hypothetical protein
MGHYLGSDLSQTFHNGTTPIALFGVDLGPQNQG